MQNIVIRRAPPAEACRVGAVQIHDKKFGTQIVRRRQEVLIAHTCGETQLLSHRIEVALGNVAEKTGIRPMARTEWSMTRVSCVVHVAKYRTGKRQHPARQTLPLRICKP